jgi:hypothetical protein
MNFFKITFFNIVFIILMTLSGQLLADNHDTQKKISEEEALPLNDPFVGDSSFSGGVKIVSDDLEIEERKKLDLYTYKLVGIIKSESNSLISLINQDGEFITVELYEELSDGTKLVDMTSKEAIFQNDELYLIMNFKNEIKETSEY